LIIISLKKSLDKITQIKYCSQQQNIILLAAKERGSVHQRSDSLIELGQKIKSLRLLHQMTLKQLAQRSNCTDVYISLLERGRGNPSIMILKNIASALNVNVVDFFVAPHPRDDDVVLRIEDRVNIEFKKGGARLQMLVRDIRNKRMQPMYTTFGPGGSSKGFYSHTGEEFGIVLTGELRLDLNGKVYRIKKGEGFYFSSKDPHRWSNPGKKKAVAVWVLSPPSF
jgi:transcriptional regulator with XRE-family HTH domain